MWFQSSSERITTIWATTLIILMFLAMNPLMPRTFQVRVGAVTTCPGAPNQPGGEDPWGGCFPGEFNTGPTGSLTTYSSPCTITTNNTVIDSKNVTCEPLIIEASNVTITNSTLIQIFLGEDDTGFSFNMSDSIVDMGQVDGTVVGDRDYTLNRVEIRGGNRSAWCHTNCTVQNSYHHALLDDLSGFFHESSMRQNQFLTVYHNTLHCDAPFRPPEGGCSADLTGYPDFAPIMHITITNTLLMANEEQGICAYGGGSLGKPFSSDPDNATYMVFKDNIFERGTSGVCGEFGPVGDFLPERTGSEYSNNRYDDGTLIPAE